jgi:arsenite methyltransferase
MNHYDPIRSYWDDVFSKAPAADPATPIPAGEIEAGLAWLCEHGGSVLDFGCGSGRLPLRCLVLGAERVTGIDLSGAAITAAQSIAAKAGLGDRSHFIQGGMEAVDELPQASFQGAILSNILDNLLPQDARLVLSETRRVLMTGGRLLVRLNPYFEPSDFSASQGYVELEPNLYREPSGLLFWNLSDLAFEDLVRELFRVEKRVGLEQPPGRMFYLVKI